MNKETDFAYRRKQVLANERQIAEVSISHDGEYATAVVMAANDLVKYDTGHVIDEGGPYALHEPSLHDDFKVMDNSQLRWFAKTGTLAPLTRQKDE